MVEDAAEKGSGNHLKNVSHYPKKEGEPSKDFKKGPRPELHTKCTILGIFSLMAGKDNQREQRSLEPMLQMTDKDGTGCGSDGAD